MKAFTPRALYSLHWRFASIQFEREPTATEERLLRLVRDRLDVLESRQIANGTGELADYCRAWLEERRAKRKAISPLGSGRSRYDTKA